jgi:outer membrane protein assembly factor BamD
MPWASKLLCAVGLALALGPLTLGCSGAQKSNLPPAQAEREEYRKALDYLVRDKSQDAIEAFTELSESASNPEVAELATLRLGEALFGDSSYAEAAEVFRQYTDQYGTSPNVPHALYMWARCHLERLPSDFWMLPPTAEREQQNLLEALGLLRRLILAYPDSHAAAKGRVLFVNASRMSCEHEMYVAEYYEDREKPKGVVLRLEALWNQDQEERRLGLVPEGYAFCGRPAEACLRLGKAYALLKKPEGLRSTLERLKANWPKDQDTARELEALLK